MLNKKLIMALLLTLFLAGVMIGPVCAKSHVYKVGKYKVSITEKQHTKLLKSKKDVSVKGKIVGKYKYVTYPIYKNYKLVSKKKYKVYAIVYKLDGDYMISLSCKYGMVNDVQIKKF